MIDILGESRVLLENAGYKCGDTFSEEWLSFTFEDESLFGFVAEFQEANQIISKWEAIQDRFLRRHINGLTVYPEKGWNAYAIFLTSSEVAKESGQIQHIEEDFRAARKIVATGITSLALLRKALYPLLPLVNLSGLNGSIPLATLTARLGFLSSMEMNVLLSDQPFGSFLESQALQQ